MAIVHPRATSISFSEDYLVVMLDDARVIQIPLIWYPVLFDSTPEKRDNYLFLGGGLGIDWPDLDLQLSVNGFLHGR